MGTGSSCPSGSVQTTWTNALSNRKKRSPCVPVLMQSLPTGSVTLGQPYFRNDGCVVEIYGPSDEAYPYVMASSTWVNMMSGAIFGLRSTRPACWRCEPPGTRLVLSHAPEVGPHLGVLHWTVYLLEKGLHGLGVLRVSVGIAIPVVDDSVVRRLRHKSLLLLMGYQQLDPVQHHLARQFGGARTKGNRHLVATAAQGTAGQRVFQPVVWNAHHVGIRSLAWAVAV